MIGTDESKLTGVQIVTNTSMIFEDPLPGVHTAKIPLAGCAWIETGEGLVVVDTLLGRKAATAALVKMRETGQKIKYVIYTHHHMDHVSGCAVFMEDHPEVIASEFLPANLDRYIFQAEHRARIAAQQFNIPEPPPDKARKNMQHFVYPTQTFLGQKTFKLGDKTFELYTARGETDDVCWVWVPELKAAFIGDLLLASFPNIGNPWKPTRFALDWAKTLKKVRAKNPEHVFYNGAGLHHSGRAALDALDDNIEVIINLHDQVVDCINRDMHITEMIHEVKFPDHLKDSPYLEFSYSRPEFFVFNVYRWYHGYFDHNPAHLLPRPEKEVNSALMEVIGEAGKVLDKARALKEEGQAQLGLQVLDVLLQAEPENVEARKLRIELIEDLGAEDTCLMSRNIWVYFADNDREFLKSRGG